jgi:hypothetical protein
VDNAGRLLAIDFQSGTTSPCPLPVRGSACHARQASDGMLWIGLGIGTAELVRFDPTAHKYLNPAVAKPAAAHTYTIHPFDAEAGQWSSKHSRGTLRT